MNDILREEKLKLLRAMASRIMKELEAEKPRAEIGYWTKDECIIYVVDKITEDSIKELLEELKTEQEEEAKQEVAPMPETGLKEHIEAKKQEESINKEQAKTEAVEAETVEPEKEKETEPKTEPEVKKTRKSKKKPEEPMVDYLSVIVKAVQDKVIENNENNVSKEDFESLLMLLEHQANTTLKFVSNYTSKG